MKKLFPYGLQVSIPGPLKESSLDIVAKTKELGGQLEDTLDILSIFVAAVTAGAFTAVSKNLAFSYMENVSQKSQANGETVFTYKTKGIDIGAYKILLRMIAQSNYTDEPLEYFYLKSSPPSNVEFGIDKVLASSLPGRNSQVPFKLIVDEDVPIDEESIIRVKFLRVLEDEEYESVDDIITVWESLVMLGGYSVDAFDGALDDIPLGPGEIYMATPSTLENTIHQFEAEQEALDSLINMLVKFHQDICPLESIEVD